MEYFFNILLILHIISGFTALVVGIIPMVAKKGGKVHNTAGLIYFWAMFGVFLTSQPMAFIKNNAFLFTIGIFSFYMVWTGYRFAKHKSWDQLKQFDKTIMLLTMITSLVMLVLAIYYAMMARTNIALILGAFGSVCLLFSFKDLRNFGKKSKPKQWIILHLTRMLGAYIATFTAFAATNIYFLPTLAIWLIPALVGTIGISFTARYFRKKFNIE